MARIPDWSAILTPLGGPKEPGATDAQLAALNDLWKPLAESDLRWLVESDSPRAHMWLIAGRRPPESYVSFLRWSNGGSFSNGERRFEPFFRVPRDAADEGLLLRETMLGYGVPEAMPHVLPFAFDGRGVFAAFDMRDEPIDAEFPIVAFHASTCCWPEATRVGSTFEAFCRGTTRY